MNLYYKVAVRTQYVNICKALEKISCRKYKLNAYFYYHVMLCYKFYHVCMCIYSLTML